GPGGGGSWRAVESVPNGTVGFHRPAWTALGGIAKGYAVDCAVERLRASRVTRGCVNAGGDLRVFGWEVRRVPLDPRHRRDRRVRGLVIADASASGSSAHVVRGGSGCTVGPHGHC